MVSNVYKIDIAFSCWKNDKLLQLILPNDIWSKVWVVLSSLFMEIPSNGKKISILLLGQKSSSFQSLYSFLSLMEEVDDVYKHTSLHCLIKKFKL